MDENNQNIVDSGNVELTPPNKLGPKFKEMVEGTIVGLPVGRNKKVVPPEQIRELAALGCKVSEIARFFGVTDDAISRNFKDQLEEGREELKITLRRAMLNNACRNNNAAVQIFLAKNLLGMSDTPINSEDQQPLPWDESSD